MELILQGKMGLTIQFESHKVELWAIYLMEHDQEVLEFYDQPPSFKIQYTNQSGRKIGHYHTPDFFVLRTDGAAWEEWKTEEQLQRLSEKYPTRYQRAKDGSWRCPPGEAHAEPLGLKYYLRTDAELHPIYIQNLMFLEDYLLGKADVTSKIQERVLPRVKETPGITLAALLTSESEISANDVYVMIVQDQLFVDLKAVPLVEPSRVQLYPDQQTHETSFKRGQNQLAANIAPISPYRLLPNTSLIWDGRLWTLVNFGETTTILLPWDGQPVQLPSAFFLQLLHGGTISLPNAETEGTANQEVMNRMNAASPGDLKEANRRFQKVMAYLQSEAPEITSDISPRTLSRWVKQFREAELKYSCGYIGLLPRTQERGNRTAKAPPLSRELLDTFIAEHFETPRLAPAASVYLAY